MVFGTELEREQALSLIQQVEPDRFQFPHLDELINRSKGPAPKSPSNGILSWLAE
jgi:hypothetical protein